MNENKTARLTALKIENRRLILGSIKGNTSCSDISRKTGLSYTCVVTLIDELIREEVLIKTSAEVTTGVGRRPIWVKFNPRKNIVCVISFVGRYSFQLCDLDGTVLYAEPQNFETLPISRGKIEAFTDKIDRLLKTEFADCTLRNINVAAPGRYDKATGEMVYAPSFAEKFNFVRMFGDRFGVPVTLKNDLKFAILAEKAYGNNKEKICDTLFIQLGGRGIGCSLFLDGKLHEGANGFSGEVGLFVVDYANGLSALGRGEPTRLFLQKSSTENFVRAAEKLLQCGTESCLEEGRITEERNAEGYIAGDKVCTEIVEGSIVLASDVIRSLAEVLDFRNVIVAKRTEMYGPAYLQKLCESINGGSQLYPIEVFPASFGEEGVAMGAYSLGAEQALDVIARDVTE